MNRDPGVHLASNGPYWQMWWWDSAGRKITRSLGPKSQWPRRSAVAECNRLAAEMAMKPGRRDVRQAPPLGDWLDRYAGLRADLGENTLELHAQTASLLREHFGPEVKLDRISRIDAAGFTEWLTRLGKPITRRGRVERTTSPISESTVCKHVATAKVIFGHAVRLDLLAFNPFDREVSTPPRLENDWHYVSIEHVDRIAAACPSPAWRALVGLCRFAGLRLGEALRLEWPDVDFQKREITVRAKLRQGRRRVTTKQRRRRVPIVPALYRLLLERHEAAGTGELLVVGIGGDNHRRDLNVIVRAAGLTPWHKPFHTLRKNCETDWLAQHSGLDVCAWMGSDFEDLEDSDASTRVRQVAKQMGHEPRVSQRHYHQVHPDSFDSATKPTQTNGDTESERSETTGKQGLRP